MFCVVSRYHGGAFVVFSGTLNDNMEVIAVEGSYASVIGGAPAAAAVFAREVDARTDADPRVAELEAALAERRGRRARPAAGRTGRRERGRALGEARRGRGRVRRASTPSSARSEVGSIDAIIPAARLRPHLIEALERGMRRTLEPGIV